MGGPLIEGVTVFYSYLPHPSAPGPIVGQGSDQRARPPPAGPRSAHQSASGHDAILHKEAGAKCRDATSCRRTIRNSDGGEIHNYEQQHARMEGIHHRIYKQ